MPKFVSCNRRVAELLDRFTGTIGETVAWLTALMAVLVTGIVAARALFGSGAIAVQESVTYMHALVIMLASAYTLRDGGHVRVDIFYHRFNLLNRAWVDVLGTILLLLPLAGFLMWISWDFVAASWKIREASADAGGLPAVFVLKTLILANGALLFVQGLAELARNLLTLTVYD